MAMYACPYATANSLIQRVDQQGEDWYHNKANDLHLQDFIWFTQMQTARQMRDRGTRVRNIDWVLDWLLVEGIFDSSPYVNGKTIVANFKANGEILQGKGENPF